MDVSMLNESDFGIRLQVALESAEVDERESEWVSLGFLALHCARDPHERVLVLAAATSKSVCTLADELADRRDALRVQGRA